MNTLQWRVLYRQFLFRIFDPEAFSAQAKGDANKLLGQFAAVLVSISVLLSFAALLLSSARSPRSDPRDSELLFLMIAEHFLIATTMLVVGIFAVLSWDATFPDERDVMVLAPLPVQTRTIFFAKVAAVATSLGLTIVLLHSAMGLVLPLIFAVRATPAMLPALTLDATSVPVNARDLPDVMQHDLKQALTSGDLAAGTGAGLAIGVWKQGEQRVFTYGVAKPDSIFEIGSITKTFTGLMLAQMVVQGKVRLDEPVRELAPAGLLTKPMGTEITLLDLATHHAGLPMMPDNFHRSDLGDQAAYGTQRLYAYLAERGVAKPVDATFMYSNLGVGLLGQVLADRAGKSYAEQLRDEITTPLSMTDTVLRLSADQRGRFLQGYAEKRRPVGPYERDGALAGDGAIRSTVGDMMMYLEANLHPERIRPLSGALELSHHLREAAGRGQQIALTWIYDPETGTFAHNGATAGFTSYVFFSPRIDSAVVVLLNNGPKPNYLLSPNSIAEHIRQRLSGDPAISLDTVIVPASTGLRGVLRAFAAYWVTMLAAGVFVYGAILGAQGFAALMLPRSLFLRFSGYMQVIAIAVIMSLYFLQRGFGGLSDLTTGSIRRLVQGLPSYWFLTLYQQLNGSMHPDLAPLARRAWLGLAAVVCGVAVVYTLSYWRTLRRIVEEPDIAPGRSRSAWLPRFGNPVQTAIGQFTMRTVARSRQHRLILAFYLGIGLAFTTVLLKGSTTALNGSPREQSMQLWIASILLMVLAVLGTRVAFALPLDLPANWIFRAIGVRSGLQSLTANRRTLLLLSVTPVWLVTGTVCSWIWPSRQNLGHLTDLGLLGLILADACLLRFRKIPFTCSWLPGKSHVNVALAAALFLMSMGSDIVAFERNALWSVGSTSLMLSALALIWICLRRFTVTLASREEQELQFEDEVALEVMGLGLYRDGVMSIDKPEQSPRAN